MVKQAERWNAANPDRPINLTPTTIDYKQMHNNLLAAFLAGSGAPDLVDIEIGKFSTVREERGQRPPARPDRRGGAVPAGPRRHAHGALPGVRQAAGHRLPPRRLPHVLQQGAARRGRHRPRRHQDLGRLRRRGQEVPGAFPDKAWTAVESPSSSRPYGLMYTNGGHVYDADGKLVAEQPGERRGTAVHVRPRQCRWHRHRRPAATSTRPSSTRRSRTATSRPSGCRSGT